MDCQECADKAEHARAERSQIDNRLDKVLEDTLKIAACTCEHCDYVSDCQEMKELLGMVLIDAEMPTALTEQIQDCLDKIDRC